MATPLSAGTLLQNRYRIVQLLGQGGFGRTYLAEDVNRFNEQCAIKEFAPQAGDHFSEKAAQLFQREAAILYQIQHPQIPKFQATFEESQRLFLVQDYVEGTSYRDLLNQRRQQGMNFSEAEIREFLQQMLPVLAHIHAKGIIHRDISPDNVVQRSRDRKPVLIDFGVVKEVVTRIQMPETGQVTTVGKPGYAPSEQMQSGRAYPNSDLYALAVTAVVLLTGREPQDLFSDVNLTWNWQQYASVSPGMAQVLTKAMSYRPGERFQSVSEMAQALGASSTAPRTAAAAPPASQMRTVAVGRQYQPTQAAPRTASRTSAPTVLPQEDDRSIWENPWAVTAIGAGLAILAGILGWGAVSLLNRQPERVQPVDTPTIGLEDLQSPDVEPTQSPTAPPEEPVEYSQRLRLRAGQTRQVEGTLRANETVNYQFQAEQDQPLRARLLGEGVLMTVLAPNGQVADAQAERVLGWQGPLQYSGQYTISLSPVQGLSESDYTLEVSLGEAEPEPEPTVEPQPTPEPTPQPTNPPAEAEILEQRVTIPPGQNSVQVSSQAGPSRTRRYVVNAQQGQVLSARLTDVSGPVVLDIRFPGGELIDDASRVLSWEGQLPVGGDYMIDVRCSTQASFTLQISVQ